MKEDMIMSLCMAVHQTNTSVSFTLSWPEKFIKSTAVERFFAKDAWKSWKGFVIGHVRVHVRTKRTAAYGRENFSTLRDISKKSAPKKKQSELIAAKWEAMPTSAQAPGRNALILMLAALTRVAGPSQTKRPWKLTASNVQKSLWAANMLTLAVTMSA